MAGVTSAHQLPCSPAAGTAPCRAVCYPRSTSTAWPAAISKLTNAAPMTFMGVPRRLVAQGTRYLALALELLSQPIGLRWAHNLNDPASGAEGAGFVRMYQAMSSRSSTRVAARRILPRPGPGHMAVSALRSSTRVGADRSWMRGLVPLESCTPSLS